MAVYTKIDKKDIQLEKAIIHVKMVFKFCQHLVINSDLFKIM